MTRKQNLARRDFLELALLTGAGATITARSAKGAARKPASKRGTGTTMYEIPDAGWRLWLDTQASWENDQLYLPDEVVLQTVPVNPPTGGWEVLTAEQGIAVTLPGTVEQYFWGKEGLRPYQDNEYFFAWDDPEVRCGAYYGVSWWWTQLDIPESFAGKKVLLRVRGARQRAEVYLNAHLIGYDIIDQTAFTCDATSAIRPGGKNVLAIRITNPGGRFDWPDGSTTVWSNGRFQRSHGFGGLDRGLLLEVHDAVYVADVWALNTPEIRTVDAHAELTNDLPHAVKGQLHFSVLNADGKAIKHHQELIVVSTGSGHMFRVPLACGSAELWDLSHPNLYRLRVEFHSDDRSIASHRDVEFGFRWFEAQGIGADAVLKLNGSRIKLYTAISWGFWGINGLWPTPALAEKEVRAAKSLNMNCLNFHRQIGREEVLQQQDQLGLLRYMEVGGGKEFAAGPADGFCAKFMTEKLLRMFRQFRSHPSLVIYCVQNEWNPDLHDPRIMAMLKRLHAEDPSRIVTLKDGVVPAGEAWYRAGGWKLHWDHGHGFSGWWCQHTAGGGGGSWLDRYYQGPDEFMYRSDNRREIVEWGEVGGSAVADNHELMVRHIKEAGGKSYDLLDHQEILSAYNTFLDHWKFRSAFPTTSALFESLGDRCYQWWSILLENFRIAERVDMCAISGWESTAIENHSGIVDNLRNHKGDPRLIAQSLQPLLPLAKLRQTVVSSGDAAEFDVYWVNESGKAVSGNLRVTLEMPDQSEMTLFDAPLPTHVPQRLVYPMASGQSTGPLAQGGTYIITARIVGQPISHKRTILAVDLAGPKKGDIRVGIIGKQPAIGGALAEVPGVHCSECVATDHYDMLLLGNGPAGKIISATQTITGTPIPWLFAHQCAGQSGDMRFIFNALPDAPAEITLYFAEIQHKAGSQRVFDVNINGQTVLKHFDIWAEAGGACKAVEKRFTLRPRNGSIVITPGDIQHGDAAFSGIKIQCGGRTITAYFGPESIKQHLGPAELIWKPYQTSAPITPQVAEIIRNGTPLLVVTDNGFFSDAAAGDLMRLGAFNYHGHVGSLRSMDNWMGNWIFVRSHPLYAGLPVNCAMKGDYQVPFFNADGLLLDGDNVEIAAAYSRDHDRNVGASTFTTALAKGKVVFHMMPAMQKIVQRRWLINVLNYLTAQ